MSSPSSVGLPEALERAATALPDDAADIRPANGDPTQLHRLLAPAAAARVLQWLLENEPGDGGQLAAAWAEDPDLDPAPLLQVDENSLPKVARKALRRAHHRLRSRGVEVGEKVAEKVVATLGRVEEDLAEAVITSLDPRGVCVAYLIEGNPSGGARIFEVMLDEARGVMGFEVYSAGRGKARKFLREITHRNHIPAVEVAPDAVRALIARVASRQPQSHPVPRAFSEWRSRVTSAPEGTPTPGESARAALDPVDPGLVDRAVELVREREVGPWPPEGPALQAAAEKIVEIEKSELIVAASARREQADQVVEETLAELFAECFAARCAERFDEMGYVLWKWEREDDARACLAAADSLRTAAPAEQPVARALVEAMLAPVLSHFDERTDGDADSPLVTA